MDISNMNIPCLFSGLPVLCLIENNGKIVYANTKDGKFPEIWEGFLKEFQKKNKEATLKFELKKGGMKQNYAICSYNNGEIFCLSLLCSGEKVDIYCFNDRGNRSFQEFIRQPHEEILLKKILLIDDDEIILQSTTKMMELMGYSIQAYQDPVDAVSKSLCVDYDLIITDYNMPGMNGTELLNAIRVAKGTIPAIIISSMFQPSEFNKLFLNNCYTGFLEKPFKLEELRIFIECIEVSKNLKVYFSK